MAKFAETIPIREQDLFSRLSAADIEIMGTYLFGTRWQTAMGVHLGVSTRQIVYWATDRKPVSRKYSQRIARLVAERHATRVKRSRARYQSMIASLSSESARSLMLAMLADEVAVRSEAIATIASRRGWLQRDQRGADPS